MNRGLQLYIEEERVLLQKGGFCKKGGAELQRVSGSRGEDVSRFYREVAAVGR